MEGAEHDFLDEIIERETAKDSRFPAMVAEAEARQLREREHARQSAARRTQLDQTSTSGVGRIIPRDRQERNPQGHRRTRAGD